MDNVGGIQHAVPYVCLAQLKSWLQSSEMESFPFNRRKKETFSDKILSKQNVNSMLGNSPPVSIGFLSLYTR